jgi:protocatechuate 3,4-dioxygenase beta subunit
MATGKLTHKTAAARSEAGRPAGATRGSNGRRELLGALSSIGVVGLLDCGGKGANRPTGSYASGSTASGTCVLDPTLTKGPFWVDEKLQRSDITMDTNGTSASPRPGLPLALQFTVFGYAGGTCSPLEGAQVDVWHCDAGGTYSDTPSLGTGGQNFLRGNQKTDTNGVAKFTTIYPGWYAGRCVHIHVKVRLFDAASNATTEATTQVFFDDSVTAIVCRDASPYRQRGVPDTPNAADAFYGSHTELLLNLRGDATSGYAASIELGVQIGSVQAG